MRVAVVSPHRDDAAFSCGLVMHALLCAGAAVTVVNVFTRSEYAVDLSTVDASVPRVEGVSRARRLEDEAFVADAAASASVDAGCLLLHDLHWLDAPLRLTVQTEQVLASPLTGAEVAQQAEALVEELAMLREFDLVFAPLALGDHIDHRIAREAAKLLVAEERLCFYEDLPYAARLMFADRNAQALHAMPSNRGADFEHYALQLPQGPHLKWRFAMHYPSQIAPEVAGEMAAYAGPWADGEDGAERWWALPGAAEGIAHLLKAAAVPCRVVRSEVEESR